jgi:hypothetical protein
MPWHQRRAAVFGATAVMAWNVLARPAFADVTRPVLRLSAEQRYDDDLLLRTGTGPLPGQSLTKLTPTLGVKRTGQNGTLEAWYAADAFFRETIGVARLDHRAAFTWSRTQSRRTKSNAEVRLYRVSDPTSLPRVGMARTLSPVLYGKATGALTQQVSERWSLRPSILAEGAQVYEPGRPPGGLLAPSLEAWWRASRRDALGTEVRWQAFAYGAQTSQAPGVFAGYRRDLSRDLSLTVKAGPSFFSSARGESRVVPRLTAELAQERETVNVGLVAGNDLVGASGFTDALWAQFASAFGNWHPVRPLRLYGVASVYRNGPALAPLFADLPPSAGVGTGYAVETGVDWSWTRHANVQGAFTRIAQVGVGTTELSRNIVAVRLVLHPAE